MEIRFTRADNPPGKLADAEIHFGTIDLQIRGYLTTLCAITYGGTAHEEAKALQQGAQLALTLDGLKLIGFAIWERRGGGGRNVTFPARQYSVNGERRSFALLRPTSDVEATNRLRDLILTAFEVFEKANPETTGGDQ